MKVEFYVRSSTQLHSKPIQKLRYAKRFETTRNSARKLVAARNAKSRFAAAFARVYEACLTRANTAH